MDIINKWNVKHMERIKYLKEPTANPRLRDLSGYLEGGLALDLACGLGANSLFLASLKYQVHAIDISDVAVTYIQQQAAAKHLTIYPRVADLTEINDIYQQNNYFDLVVHTYYLDRSLFPVIKNIIKEGGYFFMETYYQSPQTENQRVSDQYKLYSKELLVEFGEWKVHFFEENEQEGRQTIFCQKKR